MSISRRKFLKTVAGVTGSIPFLHAHARSAEGNAMPQRKFGRHDEMLSVVGLGGQTLGQAKDIPEARRIAQHAIDCGINFFENSWDYHGGRAEEWMGEALKGSRDKIFLMTKVCTHGQPLPAGGREGAMKMLEDSLRRLQTDHLDLWMLHSIVNQAEVDKAYGPGGVIEAFDLARQQGKVRYIGFTGHTDPAAHVSIIEKGYPWDATLMPVSALGALSSRAFEKEVMPLCVQKNIAVLGMKGFGGSKRPHLHGKINVEEVVRYSLSYPQVTTHCVGIDKYEYVDPLVAAASKTPMTVAERDSFVAKLKADGCEKYAVYLDPAHIDGDCGHLTA